MRFFLLKRAGTKRRDKVVEKQNYAAAACFRDKQKQLKVEKAEK